MINYDIYEDELERSSSVENVPMDNGCKKRIDLINLMVEFAKEAYGYAEDSQYKKMIIEKGRSYIAENNPIY